MLPVGFEPTISAVERPQTYALDRVGHWDRRFYQQNSKIQMAEITKSMKMLYQNSKLA